VQPHLPAFSSNTKTSESNIPFLQEEMPFNFGSASDKMPDVFGIEAPGVRHVLRVACVVCPK
jgi:hypothetical protein